MLDIYNTSSQSVGASSLITYNAARINQGGATTFTPTSDTFYIVSPGIYKIIFSGVAAATTTATSPNEVQLYQGSTAVAGATASELSESTTDFVNLSFSVLLPVSKADLAATTTASLALSVENIGIAATFTNADVTVVKVR